MDVGKNVRVASWAGRNNSSGGTRRIKKRQRRDHITKHLFVIFVLGASLAVSVFGYVAFGPGIAEANFNNYKNDFCYNCHLYTPDGINSTDNANLDLKIAVNGMEYAVPTPVTGTPAVVDTPSITVTPGTTIEVDLYQRNVRGTGDTTVGYMVETPAPVSDQVNWLLSQGTVGTAPGTWPTTAFEADTGNVTGWVNTNFNDGAKPISQTYYNTWIQEYNTGGAGTKPEGDQGGTDFRIAVPAAASGPYVLKLYGVGHNDAGARNSVLININLVAGADTTPPNVSSTVPSSGASGVPLNSQVTINWDENVNCGTVNTTNITSTSPGWAFSSCSGSQAVFTTSGQTNNTSYTVTVGTGVTDVAGNPMSASYPFSYTTLAGDVTPPTVQSTVPTNGATGVALNSSVTINWSENVNCGTVDTTNVTSTSPGWTFSICTGSQAVFTTSGQANNTSYSVTVGTGVTDVAGNPMSATYPFSYTTVAAGNNPPNIPGLDNQFKSDTTTVIPQGTYTDEGTVVFKATVSDTDLNTVSLDVEIQPVASSFTGTPTCSSPFVASGSVATATCSGLTTGEYQWQARTNDGLATSAWQGF